MIVDVYVTDQGNCDVEQYTGEFDIAQILIWLEQGFTVTISEHVP